ncbi:MAG: GNAT family N-acetyltransferase [Oscillospiraceae bacterium]|nr:GNAT family N-acetyltransferase [Oscillospiraceae bacterium]
MIIYKTMENGVQIVEYEKSLAQAVADMWNQSGDSWGGDSSVRTAEQIESDFSKGSYFNIFVALKGGEAVGLCTFDRYYKDQNTAYVHVLNVRPDYHGQKVGKELVLACVNRTIELGYPRVDIHTWPGNTKAVPLYKKCGFLWEDRADTTHLSNYIPTVLSTELFADFFKTADWYENSTRKIEIKPDGQKQNKFEFYGYSWQKDGQNLCVGFEKTGRRMRYVETDDYKIEFIAENHELAFGLNYSCTFKIENKSGKDLNVAISGKNDAGIKFDFNAEKLIVGRDDPGAPLLRTPGAPHICELNAKFYVEPITEEIDIWRMHPCVLADVYINGKHAEFGLGIEPKFPLAVNFIEKRHAIAKPGMIEDVYINLKSALSKKATVKFAIPENTTTRFIDDDFEIAIDPGETTSVAAAAEILCCGYEKLDINYCILLEDGGEVNFTRPLHLINHGFDSVFSYETDGEYCAVNGLWKFSLYKNNNHASFYSVAKNGQAQFPVPKLGKPYSDELNLIKPSDVRIYNRDNVTIFEADYKSESFVGAVLTKTSEFGASGVISQRHKVTNISDKPTPSLYLSEGFWSSVGRRAVFMCEGEIHEIADNTAYGFSDTHSGKIEENWIFDNTENNKSGVYWDRSYKPDAKWGEDLYFEHEIGELLPGAVFETKPVVYMSGIFINFREFRNYVLAQNEEISPHTISPLEICVNDHNPIIASDAKKIETTIKNNRLTIYGGDIKISSPDGLFSEAVQTNPEKENTKSNIFDLSIHNTTPGIYPFEIDFDFLQWKKTHNRTLFVYDAAAKISFEKKDGTYTIQNDKLCYKLSPEYFASVYSMKYGENEWLFSKYPNHEPYAWWNPFIGGINMNIWQMSANLLLREKTTAEFVSIQDNFGTNWSGIKATTSICEFADHKGLSYEQYYLTLPGVPVLCYFVRFKNLTGGYKHIGYDMNAFISGKENLGDIYARTTSEKEEYNLKMGDAWAESDGLVRISHENASKRSEKLYVYTDTLRNNGGLGVASDINQCSVWANANTNLKSGESSALRPVFFVLSEKELTRQSLVDLERVKFLKLYAEILL